MTWYNKYWLYRKKVTIQNANVDTNLTNHPLYVPISADSDMAKAMSNGYDIRFTLLAGTELAYERPVWTGGGGSAVTGHFWVDSDPLAATTTDIYMYYGNSAALDGEDATNVWVNFTGVWHLDSDFNDSTGNGINLTKSGAGVTHETGIVADGAEFASASTEYASVDTAAVTDYPYTMETWFNADISGNNTLMYIGDKDVSSQWQQVMALRNADNTLFLSARDGDAANGLEFTTNTWSDNVWSYGAIIGAASDDRRVYLNADAANKGTDITTQASGNWDRTALAAERDATPAGYLDGLLDEVRISNIARSEAYLKFVHANITEGDNELTWASEEASPVKSAMMAGVF